MTKRRSSAAHVSADTVQMPVMLVHASANAPVATVLVLTPAGGIVTYCPPGAPNQLGGARAAATAAETNSRWDVQAGSHTTAVPSSSSSNSSRLPTGTRSSRGARAPPRAPLSRESRSASLPARRLTTPPMRPCAGRRRDTRRHVTAGGLRDAEGTGAEGAAPRAPASRTPGRGAGAVRRGCPAPPAPSAACPRARAPAATGSARG